MLNNMGVWVCTYTVLCMYEFTDCVCMHVEGCKVFRVYEFGVYVFAFRALSIHVER